MVADACPRSVSYSNLLVRGERVKQARSSWTSRKPSQLALHRAVAGGVRPLLDRLLPPCARVCVCVCLSLSPSLSCLRHPSRVSSRVSLLPNAQSLVADTLTSIHSSTITTPSPYAVRG
jgi:hypothetical protein